MSLSLFRISSHNKPKTSIIKYCITCNIFVVIAKVCFSLYNDFMKNFKAKFVTFTLAITVLLSSVSFSGCDTGTITEKSKNHRVQESLEGIAISYIDVGQGDSILIKCKKDAMLIDAGENDKGDTVVSYLESQNVNHLKYAVGTHPHSDHIGGMDTVIDSIKTDTFICPDTTYSTKTWNDVLSSCKYNNTKVTYAVPQKSYKLGDAIFTILHPEKNGIYSDCNNFSVVVKVTYGERAFLFTGDAEELSEEEMLNNGYNLQADVLKIGHHGSHSSTERAFLNAVDPSVAIISCGENNEYGHPHRETLKLLEDEDIEVHRTDSEGTVVVTSDGDNLAVTSSDTTEKVINTTSDNKKVTTASSKTKYVGNKNSHKLHYSNCDSLTNTNDNNKVYFDNKKEALKKGYTPCKNCNP